MKKLSLLCVLAGFVLPLQAASYLDSTGDTFTGAGLGILDIVSVEVTNDATDLVFKVNLAGNPVTTDWGRYLIAVNSVVGGSTTTNGWGRPISMPAGMDFWIGSWVDGGNGAQLYTWGGAAFTLTSAPTVSKDSSSVTITTTLASMGLSVNDTFEFDVFTSGGGGADSAVDALANPNQSISDWGNSYASTSTLSYTVVPEPTFGALALVAMALGFRRRR